MKEGNISMVHHLCSLDCPSSKGNHAPHPKFERPNGKKTKSKIFEIGQELDRPAHLKAQ